MGCTVTDDIWATFSARIRTYARYRPYLHVKYSGIDVRRVVLSDQMRMAVMALQLWVWIVKPGDISIRLQHVDPMLHSKAMDKVLTDVIKVETHVPIPKG
eukprot:scaffold262142_cov37-Tisochrysis_lutea.AAC.2